MAETWTGNGLVKLVDDTSTTLTGVVAIENTGTTVVRYSKTAFSNTVRGFAIQPKAQVSFRTAGETIFVKAEGTGTLEVGTV